MSSISHSQRAYHWIKTLLARRCFVCKTAPVDITFYGERRGLCNGCLYKQLDHGELDNYAPCEGCGCAVHFEKATHHPDGYDLCPGCESSSK